MASERVKIIGMVHNAKRCTFDGRDCWISSLCDVRGDFLCHRDNVEEHASPELAREWIRTEAQRRNMELVKILERP